jgi:TetR/AcrR family transcriptional regulator of autoinduction and epiphytic fitness
VTIVDGRTQRGERNREAIVEALVACYADGLLRPSVDEVAERAGVSARSVHNHFVDVEALRAEVAQRQWEHFKDDAAVPADATIEQLVEARAKLYEGITPVRRAALLSVHASPTIARNLARFDRILRRQLVSMFPQSTTETIDALEALTSWDTWNRLRTAQGCSVARARRILSRAISTLTEGSAP